MPFKKFDEMFRIAIRFMLRIDENVPVLGVFLYECGAVVIMMIFLLLISWIVSRAGVGAVEANFSAMLISAPFVIIVIPSLWTTGAIMCEKIWQISGVYSVFGRKPNAVRDVVRRFSHYEGEEGRA